MPRQRSPDSPIHADAAPFVGFAPPTSNTTYAPNQFFDVCLPHCSRGTVRVVAFIIRKTLGWCDTQGNPQSEQHTVSYAAFEHAGISRDMIKSAIEEAMAAHFIRCVRQPRSKKSGQPSVSGLYELQWDERGEYIKDPKRFRGFFAGEGNRTYIPNQFFDHLVPNESLAVLKVVGSIIRLSIGYQTKWGHRRQNVVLSYQHIQNYSRLKDRKSLSAAIKLALKNNYVERVEEGYFDRDGGKLSKAAVYAVKWLNEAAVPAIGRKSPPVEIQTENRSEIPTGIGQKSPPVDRSENPTGIEIKQSNNTFKQQHADIAVAFKRLKEFGFDIRSAQAIASKYPADRIMRQIEWIEERRVRTNRLGMLRAAIQENWPAPVAASRSNESNSVRASGTSLEDALTQTRERLLGVKANTS